MESKAGFFRGSIGVLQLDDDDSKSSHAQVFLNGTGMFTYI